MNDEHSELKLAYLQANDALRKVRNEKDHDEAERINEATDTIRHAIDLKWGRQLQEAKDAYATAKRAYEDEKIAKAKESPPLELGKVYCLWAPKYKQYYLKQKSEKVIEARGIFSVCVHEDTFPENIENGLPDVGDYYFRLVGKDGKPGKKFKRYSLLKWLPEGVDPNTKGE